jgi:hypothetical protein
MASGQQGGQLGRAAADAEAPIDPGVMEKVLEETLLAADSDQPIDAAELRALASVGRRHAGQQLSLDPIVVELVQSILRHRFGEPIQSSPAWGDMPRTIAQTLWESPEAHQRLDRLWDRLAGVPR